MQCASCTTTGLLPGWACISLCRWGAAAALTWRRLPELLAGDGHPAQPLTGVAFNPRQQQGWGWRDVSGAKSAAVHDVS